MIVIDEILPSAVAAFSGIMVFFIDDTQLDTHSTYVICGVLVLYSLTTLVECAGIFLEAAPLHWPIEYFKRRLMKIQGVTNIHALHVWTIAPGKVAASFHLRAENPQLALEKATKICKIFNVAFSTIQVEGKEAKLEESCPVQ